MIKSLVASVSVKMPNGKWQQLPVFELEYYPIVATYNGIDIVLKLNSNQVVTVAVKDQQLQILRLGQKAFVRIDETELRIKIKRDIIIFARDVYLKAVSYSYVSHFLSILVASVFLMVSSVQVIPPPPEKVSEKEKSVNLAEMRDLLKKVEQNRIPEPPPAPVDPAPQVVQQKTVAPAPPQPRPQPPVPEPPKQAAKVPARPAPRPVAAPKPNPSQIAKSQAVQSLAFLSNPSAAASVSSDQFSKSGAQAASSALQGAAGVPRSDNGVLSGMGRDDGAPVQTRGARGVSAPQAFSGQGRGLDDVQGRVAASQVQGTGRISVRAPVSGLNLSGSGQVSESLIEQILAKHIDRLRYCYERQLLSDSTLRGRLTMQWTISPSGKVSQVRVADSQLNHATLHNCVAGEIAKIAFPKVAGGDVQISYPFVFESQAI